MTKLGSSMKRLPDDDDDDDVEEDDDDDPWKATYGLP